jgi:hypothetical protein
LILEYNIHQLRNLLILQGSMKVSKGSPERYGTPMIERVALEEAKSFQRVAMEKETGETLEMSSMQRG